MSNTNYKQHNKTSYDEIAKEYLENNLRKQPEYLFDILSNLPKGMKILDIGSGPGNLIPILQTLHPVSILELDNSSKMIALGKKSFPALNVKFVHADYSKFKSKDKFDFVIAHLSFVHLPPKELPTMLEKIKSHLNTNSYFFANYFVDKENSFKLVKLDYNPNREESRYFAFYQNGYIHSCYKKAGFEIIKKGIHKGKHFKRYNLLARVT